MNNKIAVLVPCYNEEKTIGKVISDFHLVLPQAEIYVYNNNSTDATAKIAKDAGAIVRDELQQGKGNVVRRMFQEIDADCYIMVDGDDTYPSGAAPELVKYILHNNADMVIGDRLSSTYFNENKRPLHNLGNIIVRGCINKLFGTKIKDIMTGYRAFSWRFVKTFPPLSQGFEIETEMTIHAISMNMQIENFIINYKDRPSGSLSKLNTISDGAKVIKTIFSLFKDYKPLEFFTFFAGLFLLTDAIVFFSAVWIPFKHTGIVEHFPTLLVNGFIALASLLMIFTGMILDSIRKKERRAFEFKLSLLHILKNSLKK